MTLRLDEALAPYLVAELRLEELWHVVDNVKVGTSGRAFLVDEAGRIIADGRQNGKSRIARGERIDGHPLAAATATARRQYTRPGRRRGGGGVDGARAAASAGASSSSSRPRTRSHRRAASSGSCCCS